LPIIGQPKNEEMKNGNPDSVSSRYLELYDNLSRSSINIETKGKTTPYTSLNGNMFIFLTTEGSMGLRLSKSNREEFTKEFGTKIIERFGKAMKEYVEVPHTLLVTKKLKKYILKSYEYAASLSLKSNKRS